MTAAPMTPQPLSIRIDRIRVNAGNPRRRFDPVKDAELVDSVKKVGVLQPVLVRPLDTKHFELVFGQRRMKAAISAGLEEIPATVRDLNDREVLELQLVENRQRADVDPLDEGEGFRRLHVDHRLAIDEIAARIGVSRGTVYARIKLTELAPDVKKLLQSGELDASRALLVARLPVGIQTKAAKAITREHWVTGNVKEPMSYRSAKLTIEHGFLLRLADAPWKLGDEGLVAKAGSCTACPKRTGNQPPLLEVGDESKDLCTDGACFKLKTKAHGDGILAAAKKRGLQVVPAKDALGNAWDGDRVKSDSGWTSLDATCYDDPKGRTYRELLKKPLEAEKPELALGVVRRKDGGVIELVAQAGLKQALRKAGHGFAKPKAAAPASASDTAYKHELAARKRARELAREKIVAGAEKLLADPLGLWRAVALELIPWNLDDYYAGRIDETKSGKDSEKAFDAWLRAADVRDLQRLLIEIFADYEHSGGGAHEELLAMLGLEEPAIYEAALAEVKAAAKAAKDAKKKTPAKKSAGRKK